MPVRQPRAQNLQLSLEIPSTKEPEFRGPDFLIRSGLITTDVFNAYWQFAAERQRIFLRRAQGGLPPWTNDPILLRYRFTNAYRAADRVSQFLIRHVQAERVWSPAALFFRTVLFKLFNRIETWQLLERSLGTICPQPYRFKDYDRVLTEAMSEGRRIYSAAYIMPSGGSKSQGQRKHQAHLALLESMLKNDLPSRISDCTSMKEAFGHLRAYPMIGDFLAYQYVTDLNYSTLTDFPETEFVMPGPGARSGIRKCFADLGQYSEADIIQWTVDHQEEEFAKRDIQFRTLWGRPLQLIDCQNLFCEVDKYARVRYPEVRGLSDRVRIKQEYRHNTEPIEYWFPPKWGLNEKVAHWHATLGKGSVVNGCMVAGR